MSGSGSVRTVIKFELSKLKVVIIGLIFYYLFVYIYSVEIGSPEKND